MSHAAPLPSTASASSMSGTVATDSIGESIGRMGCALIMGMEGMNVTTLDTQQWANLREIGEDDPIVYGVLVRYDRGEISELQALYEMVCNCNTVRRAFVERLGKQ